MNRNVRVVKVVIETMMYHAIHINDVLIARDEWCSAIHNRGSDGDFLFLRWDKVAI